MNNNEQSKQIRNKRISKHLEQVNLFAAGIDIGSQSHFVSVPEGLATESVREFSCFTGDLNRMADWLVEIGIQTVAMESTGIYWIPAYEILEERGLIVLLVNSRHIKNVPGRKTDVLDCQWIQQLHTYGLLEGAFRPEEETVALRTYMRQRETLTQQASDQIRRMQKALRQMNLLLDNVVSDIDGVTGMKIIRAILEGERDATILARLRDGRCKKDEKTIAASLEGHYREEHIFSLRQSVELYDTYQNKIIDCDRAIQAQLDKMDTKGDKKDLPPAKKSKSKNTPKFDVRGELYQITGVDLTRIDGLNESSILKILSETGSDISSWPTEKHFCSWLGLSPGNKVTGGKSLSGKTKPSANRAAAAFRLAAFGLLNSQSALGAYCRRQRTRLGAPKAITATAHKLARTFYSMLKNGTEYVDKGQDYYEKQYHDRIIKNLKK
ncbi:MAG: IS110 family transposase, partial [Methyloprofundus sp.]|nr:IS110 family transposase [Methyloprofundus sp.]